MSTPPRPSGCHAGFGRYGAQNGGGTPTISSDEKDLTEYLWPIVREMIKTAIENEQNLIIEGCYIPFDWAASFEADYFRHIQYRCLVMSEAYIRNHFADIKQYANVVEQRLDNSDCTVGNMI